MDGIHDLGGRQGFGTLAPPGDEAVFRQRWEAQVFAIIQAAFRTGVIRNADQFRHAIERIDPAAYLTHGYYGRWLGGLETLLREAGVVDLPDLERRIAELGGDPAAPAAARPAAAPHQVDRWPGAEAETDTEVAGSPPTAAGRVRGHAREITAPPRFAVGDGVRTVAHGKPGHTRLPAYARNRPGRIVTRHGAWVLPDSNAHGHGERPEHLYSVAFRGEDLWGEAAEAGTTVHLDLFESYLVEKTW